MTRGGTQGNIGKKCAAEAFAKSDPFLREKIFFMSLICFVLHTDTDSQFFKIISRNLVFWKKKNKTKQNETKKTKNKQTNKIPHSWRTLIANLHSLWKDWLVEKIHLVQDAK